MHYDFSNFKTSKILIIGDIMLDEYWSGPAARLSPEAPVPVVDIAEVDLRPGGASNVALNIKALGAEPLLLGVVGQDDNAEKLINIFDSKALQHDLVKSNKYPTITKLRILSSNQQLIRLDKEQSFSLLELEVLRTNIEKTIGEMDVVVLSDYAKGTLGKVQEIITLAKKLQKTVIVDPKSADFSIYKDADIITPNLKEFEAVVGKCENVSAIEAKARGLINKYNLNTIVITRGKDGISVIQKDNTPYHVSAVSNEVYDVTGAGDTVVAAIATAIAADMDIKDAVNIANIAASVVVAKVGTSVASLKELSNKINYLHNINDDLPQGAFATNELTSIIAKAKARGERVVFTNGCYDVLHYGHTRYLDKAKSYGDRLVVAVNTDESVKKLKGDGRPHHNLAQRMEVLSALKAVDWVVAFSEDTPGECVKALSPDVIVKVDENFKTIEDIPESEGVLHVLSRGGQVKLLSRTEGCSSTQLIEKELT